MERSTKMTMILCAALAIGLRGAPSQQPAPKNNAKAKTPTKAKPKPGVISGRVFLITKSGDIKPARLAKMYLLPWGNDVDKSVAKIWGDELDKAAKKYIQELNAANKDGSSLNMSDAYICRKELATYDEALTATLRWAVAQSVPPEIVIGNADEEGNFKFAGLAPGIYTVAVFGRAGFNEARWLDTGVTVKPDTETSLKLSSSEAACIVE